MLETLCGAESIYNCKKSRTVFLVIINNIFINVVIIMTIFFLNVISLFMC